MKLYRTNTDLGIKHPFGRVSDDIKHLQPNGWSVVNILNKPAISFKLCLNSNRFWFQLRFFVLYRGGWIWALDNELNK